MPYHTSKPGNQIMRIVAILIASLLLLGGLALIATAPTL